MSEPTKQDDQLAAALRDLADEVQCGYVTALACCWTNERTRQVESIVGLSSSNPDHQQMLADALDEWGDEIRTIDPEASGD